MRKCKLSKLTNYQHLYDELHQKVMHRLDRPQQVADFYVLGRAYKYVMLKTGKAQGETLEESFEKDYYSFLAMYQQRLDAKKQEELQMICFQIHSHRQTIFTSAQNQDILEQNGFSYSDSTFDDLFVNSFQESFINVSTDSSEEREEEEFEEEEKKQSSLSAATSKTSQGSNILG